MKMSPFNVRPPYYYPYPPYPPYYQPPYYYGGYQNPFLGGFFGGLTGSLLTPFFYGRPPFRRYY
jgi:hypothetical protein